MSLSGKVAIVTGSGRGLGLAYARELARQGAAVVINDVDAEVAAEAVRTIEADGGRAAAVVAPGRQHRGCQAAGAGSRHGVRPPGHPGHQRRHPAGQEPAENDRRGLRRRHQRPPPRHLHLRPGSVRLLQGERHRRPDHHHRLAHRAARQLRPDQLRRRQGRHRGHGPHLGAGNEEGRRDRQRRHPGGRHGHDQDRPLLPESRGSGRARRGHAGLLPPRARFRNGRRRLRTGRVPRLR